MKYYSVTKTDTDGASEEEIVSADSMSVDMGCLLFHGTLNTANDGSSSRPLIRAYGIGGWINAVIK